MKVKIDHMEFDIHDESVEEKAKNYIDDETPERLAKEWAYQDILEDLPYDDEVEIPGTMKDYKDEEALREAIFDVLLSKYDQQCYDFEIVDVKE